MSGRAAGLRWGTRTFLTLALVVCAGVVTAALVALAVGPPLFHQHLLELGGSVGAAQMDHVEQAFIDAGSTSLGVGLAVALLLATALAWLETRRLSRPLNALTTASAQLEAGDFAARVPRDTTPEFDAVAVAFNDMAERLHSTEESRRRLLGDVAHELRTPLATLAAELEAVIDDVLPWDAASQDVLIHQVERLRLIAQDLDDVSRAEEGRFTLDRREVATEELIAPVVAAAAGRFEAKGVQLRSIIDDGPVWADPQRVGQILSNLLDNALRHTPAGGNVTVTAHRDRTAVIVTVTDTGDGLSADQLQHVFERFYRADAARARDAGGSGIGLTIARSLALAHDGSLTASSTGPGNGSTFTLVLPAPQTRAS